MERHILYERLKSNKPTAHKTRFTFGLNSSKCPPQGKQLVSFEEGLIKLVKNLRFRKLDNKFQ